MKADFNDAAAVRYGGQDIVEIRAKGSVLWQADLEGALLASAADPDPAGNVLVMHQPWDTSTLEDYDPVTGDFTGSVSARSPSDFDLRSNEGTIIRDGYFAFDNDPNRRIFVDNAVPLTGATLVMGVLPGDVSASTYIVSQGGQNYIEILAGFPLSFDLRLGGFGRYNVTSDIMDAGWRVLTIRQTPEDGAEFAFGEFSHTNPSVNTTTWRFNVFGWHVDTTRRPPAGILGPIILQDKADGSRSDLVPVAQAYIRGKIGQMP